MTNKEKTELQHKLDKSFAEFVLKGVSYDKSTDYFRISPGWIELLLEVAEDKRTIWELAGKKGR